MSSRDGVGKPQALFWFAHAKLGREDVSMAVAAFTERSAKMQVRKRLGKQGVIERISPVPYAHAWVMQLCWTPECGFNGARCGICTIRLRRLRNQA